MLHARGDLVNPLQASTTNTVVVLVVEHEIWLTEVDGDDRAPQDRGPSSRRGSRRRLQSGISVVNLLPVTSARGASVGMSNLVHTTVLSSTVMMLPMEVLHRDFGQAEITALAVRKSAMSFGLFPVRMP